MADWTYQSSGTVVSNGNGASLSPGAPSGVTAGDLLLLYTGQRIAGAAGPGSISGWERIGTLGYGGPALDIWARIATGTGDTPTVDWDGTNASFAWIERRAGGGYTDLATIVAHSATDNGQNQTTLRLPAVPSVSAAGCTVIGFGAKNNTAVDATAISHAQLTVRNQLISGTASRQHAASGDLYQTTAVDYDGTDFTVDGTSESLASRGIVLYLRTASAAAPTISDAGDESFQLGESITITGTGFGASQGAGVVKISPADDVDDAGAVSQTVTAWGDTSITITVSKGALPFGAAYIFVRENGGSSNAAGYAVSLITRGAQRSMLLGLG